MLVYSGRGRDANNILQKQQSAMSNDYKFKLVRRMRDRAFQGVELLDKGQVDDFGALLHESWVDKKGLAEDITQDYFDVVYQKAIDAGAVGGKLLGAGGGGFFLFYVPTEHRERVAHAVTTDTECKVYDFEFFSQGSGVVYACEP
jgi:D-glycero-alpha-D-manno-heptose-7-phosphate kinase